MAGKENKVHSTNYIDTFIEIVDDCKVPIGTTPPDKTPRTIASIQFGLISKNPYEFTSDDIIFYSFAEKNSVQDEERERVRQEFFTKGQPCMRSSPLCKTYGWGVHSDGNGRLALYARESGEYLRLSNDPGLRHLKAMKPKK